MVENEAGEEELKLQQAFHSMTTLVPVALGVGCGKLRHKLSALLHILKLEVGVNVQRLKQYCRGVVSICTDSGTESLLAGAPQIDLEDHIRREAELLAVDVSDVLALEGQDAVEFAEAGHGHIEDGVRVSGRGIVFPMQPLQAHRGEGGAGDGPGGDRRLEAVGSLNLCAKLFPNSLFIPGLKHGLDNVLHDVWSVMQGKQLFLQQLRAIEYVLKEVSMRNKIVHLFFDQDTPLDRVMTEQLRYFKSSLKSLRWHEVINFVKELKVLQYGLKKRWSLQKWLTSMPKSRHDELSEGKGPAGGAHYKLFDSAVTSQYFWSYADMLVDVSSCSELLSRWCESCWYHGRQCSERTCPYKGAKAPELACGIYKFVLQRSQERTNARLGEITPHLTAVETQALVSDWHSAHARLSLEMEFKFHFWSLLPWKLCGIACSAIAVGRIMAQECIKVWRAMSRQQQEHSHVMTRRFLDPSWKGPKYGTDH